MGKTTYNFHLLLVVLISVQEIEHCHGRSSPYANVSCSPNERKALLNFKDTLIDHASRLSSWTGEDCCSWKGVSCSITSSHVVKLDLRNHFQLDGEFDVIYFDEYPGDYSSVFLKGQINPSLVELKHLEFLDLSMNDFSGSQIPGFIGSLTKLKYLNLSSAGFAGKVPIQLGNLSSLQYLDLSSTSAFYAPSNSLSSDDLQWSHPLSSLKYLGFSGVSLKKDNNWLHSVNVLPSLLELHLSSCQLQSMPPSANVNFTSLELLDLHGNGFNATIPLWLFNITNIRHLDLSENTFHGPIPSEIGSCKFLEVLDLHWNHLEGEIPEALTQLCSLHELNLERNRFRGEIWDFFRSPSGCIHNSLRMLNLGSNLYTGYLPVQLWQFKHLELLDLHLNSFQGPIPGSLGRLSCLRRLFLNENYLNGSVPESFGQLSKLEVLDVCYNSLGGTVSELHFENLTGLIVLGLSSNSFVFDLHPTWVPPFQLQAIAMASCRLGPRFPQWLQTQKNVVLLSMSNASISDAIPDWFEDFSSGIVVLDLSYNHIRKSLPKFRKSSSVIVGREIRLNANKFEGPLATFPHDVVLLDVSNNSLSGQIHETIDHMWPRLRELQLSGNQLNGSVPHSICNMKELAVLDLSKNQLSGRLPLCWKQLVNLEVIDLSNNNLSGRIPTSLGSIQYLRSLHLQRNSFRGKIPASLANLEYLSTLDLGENAFSGVIPSWIGEKLFSLEILSIHSNEFDGEIPQELCHLSNLLILNLAQNRISGAIPHCFNNFSAMIGEPSTVEHWLYAEEYEENVLVSWKGRKLEYTKTLKFLRSIDISRNNLIGEIPNELLNLTGLQNLNISENKLQGLIPSNIGNLKMMESLDLSQNKLSGPIPQSISALNYLSHLNLSYNNLSGRIPLGNQLQTLDDKSIYTGNSGLCGPPLQSCPGDESSEGHEQVEENIDDESESRWFHYGLIIGFVVGFLGVCGNLYFHKSLRHSYFQMMDRVYDMLWVTIAVKANWLRRKFCGGNSHGLEGAADS